MRLLPMSHVGCSATSLLYAPLLCIYSRLGDKCDHWSGVPSTSDRLAMHTARFRPWAASMGVVAIMNTCSRLWSPARASKCGAVYIRRWSRGAVWSHLRHV